MDSEISSLFHQVRDLILSARKTASRGVDALQMLTNFKIGRRIVKHDQNGAERAEYGKETLKELSKRLTQEFGRGFSRTNLAYMRKFFLIYRNRLPEKSQTAVSCICHEYRVVVPRPDPGGIAGLPGPDETVTPEMGFGYTRTPRSLGRREKGFFEKSGRVNPKRRLF